KQSRLMYPNWWLGRRGSLDRRAGTPAGAGSRPLAGWAGGAGPPRPPGSAPGRLPPVRVHEPQSQWQSEQDESIASKRSIATQRSMITHDGRRSSDAVRIESRPPSGRKPRVYRGTRLARMDPAAELMDGGRTGPQATLRSEPNSAVFGLKPFPRVDLARVFTSKPDLVQVARSQGNTFLGGRRRCSGRKW